MRIQFDSRVALVKMAIHGRVRALAIELTPNRNNVNAGAPGNIVTPLNDVLYDLMAESSGKSGARQAGKTALVNPYLSSRLGQVSDNRACSHLPRAQGRRLCDRSNHAFRRQLFGVVACC